MKRHTLASAALGFALLVASPVMAQTPSFTPAHLALAKELMDLTNVTPTFQSIYGEFTERVRQMTVTRPEFQKDATEIAAELKPEADRRIAEITALSADVFAKNISESDLKDIVTFFKSPAGQRYNVARPKAVEEIYGLLEPWSLQTSNVLFDRFTQEMRKRGHQL